MRVPSVLLVLALTACGGSDGPTDNEGDDVVLAQGSMSAKVDGVTWRASAALVASYTGGVLNMAGVEGTGTNVRSLGLLVPAPQPGTYTFSNATGANASYTIVSDGTASGWLAVGTNGSGTVTINAISASGARGTFTLNLLSTTGAANRSITEGRFELKF